MKVWRFYRKPDKNDINKTYDLYAITNNKEFARQFIQTRNMDKFIMRKSSVSKDEWKEYANENMGSLIGIHPLSTKGINENGNIDSKKVEILMTVFEQQCSDADQNEGIMIDESFWYKMPPYSIFNDDILDALRNIEYVSLQRFTCNLYNFTSKYIKCNLEDFLKYTEKCTSNFLLKDDNTMIYDDGDFVFPNVVVDELNVFIESFKNIL